MVIRAGFNRDGRFLREEAVCGDGGHGIDDEVVEGAVSRMFQLRDVLQFVVDRLNDRPFAKQYLVGDAHQAVLHVVLHLGYQLNAIDEQFLEQFF